MTADKSFGSLYCHECPLLLPPLFVQIATNKAFSSWEEFATQTDLKRRQFVEKLCHGTLREPDEGEIQLVDHVEHCTEFNDDSRCSFQRAILCVFLKTSHAFSGIQFPVLS